MAAEDGWSAIEALQADRPDLVLLDLRLPVLDGWTVLEFARRAVPSPAVALMTVCSDADSIERGLRAGIAGCVFKPFRIRDLVTTCDRILWRRSGDADDHQDRRRQRRRPLALDVTALAGTTFEVAPAKLVDLSMGGAQVGHFDRVGVDNNSWNSTHGARGCSQANVSRGGGAGLLYCFAVN